MALHFGGGFQSDGLEIFGISCDSIQSFLQKVATLDVELSRYHVGERSKSAL